MQTAAARRAFQKPSHRNGTYAGSKADFMLVCWTNDAINFGCSNNNTMICALTVPYGHNRQTNKQKTVASQRAAYRHQPKTRTATAQLLDGFCVRGGPSSFQKLTKWGSPRFAVDEDTKCSANTEPFSAVGLSRDPWFRDGGACRGSSMAQLNPLKPTGTRKTS